MSPEKSVIVTGNKTLTVADVGIVQIVKGDYVITLPTSAAATAGSKFIIQNGGLEVAGTPEGTSKGNKSAAPSVKGVSADGITGNGFTPATNKSAINTKATAQVGDRLELTGSGATGAGAWFTTYVRGVWAREA